MTRSTDVERRVPPPASAAARGNRDSSQRLAPILFANAAQDLSAVLDLEVQAVIYEPVERPGHVAEVYEAVRIGALRVERTITGLLHRQGIVDVFESRVPRELIAFEARAGLLSDVLELFDIARLVTGASRVELRLMTSRPNRRHGFHVDLGPLAPTVRVLRVYGCGTEYVDPDNVISAEAFYRYVTERERTARSLASALRAGRSERAASLDETLAGLDRVPAFLKDPSAVRTVPDGSVVLIKTVSVEQLWPGRIRRGRGLGWIHRSPPEGAPRLVAAVTGSCPARQRGPRIG